jgi:hypothetical protein
MPNVVCEKPPLESACTAKTYPCLNSWLDRCNNDHDDCKKTLARLTTPEELRGNDETNGRLLPQRLLDVTPLGESGDIRLIEVELEYEQSQHNFPGRKGYVTLSYRWGKPPPPMALLNNVNSLDEGIPFDFLPKTFQDAIMVTRSINGSYIWIDSLCIYPIRSRFECHLFWRHRPPETAVFIATFPFGIGEYFLRFTSRVICEILVSEI